MSDDYARSCSGKKRYNSFRRANEAAKSSKIAYGIELNAYGPCKYCQRYHVGATHPWEGRTAREEAHEQDSAGAQ